MNKMPKNPIKLHSPSDLRHKAIRNAARKAALLAAWAASSSTLLKIRVVHTREPGKPITTVGGKGLPPGSTSLPRVGLVHSDDASKPSSGPRATAPPKPPRPDLGYAQEQAAYESRRPGLLDTAPGRFVVFVGDEMAGPFDTFREAHRDSRRQFGPGPLYIKQVLAEERIFEPIAIESCRS